jgi:hypothetical protein
VIRDSKGQPWRPYVVGVGALLSSVYLSKTGAMNEINQLRSRPWNKGNVKLA